MLRISVVIDTASNCAFDVGYFVDGLRLHKVFAFVERVREIAILVEVMVW